MSIPDHDLFQLRRRRGWWLIVGVLLGFVLVPLLTILAMGWKYHRMQFAMEALERENAIATKEGVIETPWLPMALFPRRLPHSITIHTSGSRVKTVAPWLRDAPSITRLAFTDADLSEAELNAVTRLRDLEWLSLARTNIDNDSLFTLLQELDPIGGLDVSNTQINDDLFGELDTLANLQSLNIANTATTLTAVRSFETRHPSVIINWRPQLTPSQQQSRDALLARGFSVYDEYGPPSIMDGHDWVIGFPLEGLPSAADWRDISNLGQVVRWHIQGAQYTSEVRNDIERKLSP